ncbi:MAG: NAD(+) synthase [Clostridia bacterium]|nr:NAD(+) synthase [Clostridia bacterium]
MKDVLRGALCTPSLKVADVTYNKNVILQRIEEARQKSVGILVFPELSLTGYTCGDLFASKVLLCAVEEALSELAAATADLLVAVGAPLEIAGRVYNCAVLLSNGEILGVVPKTYVLGPAERYFASGADLAAGEIELCDCIVPVGTDLLFTAADGTVVGVEICADLFAPLPLSTEQALAGAEVILNLAASNEEVGKRTFRRDAVLQQSARTLSAYLFASAGSDESAADMIYSGHSIAALCGSTVAENTKCIDSDYLLVFDMDLGVLRYDRRQSSAFSECIARYGVSAFRHIPVPCALTDSDGALLNTERLPFVPSDKSERLARCIQIFDMQAAALARRLSITGGKLTVGISGGLDSTLALLVAIRAMESLKLPRTNITAVTMPCFGTSDETLTNALALMKNLGVTSRTVVIKDAVLQHFKDIGHDPTDFSVTYENAQARERTQVLMDIANKEGGIVLGTGDLSEAALGWCTYNGDHMSMYNVNADIPKTLVRWIIASVAEADLMPEATDVLLRVLDTPISPELLPPDAVGKIAQKTEDIVGPYALHDFFLYYAIRYQYTPTKIFELAKKAFNGHFDGATIKKWLTVFFRRFFTQQFKRNAMPDGVKVGSVSLSPRGDWHMPSDASAALWLAEIEAIET